MPGDWQLAAKSEAQINAYVEQADVLTGIVPWKAISLHDDGTCQVEIEAAWVSESGHILKAAGTPATCTWLIKDIMGYSEGGDFQDVRGVSLRFEHVTQESAYGAA